uniref:Nucleoporin 160 n=1 Tax=Latimeria chalumnae TaxID=7897 RepID=H3BIC0_LATCH
SSGDTLQLVEESLDSNLLNNAVRLKIVNCNVLPGGVWVSETRSHVAILFLTNQTVHRLILPHPCRIYRSELVTELQIQSIFTDIGRVNFRDPSNSSLIPVSPGLAPGSSTSTAWLTSEGEALFAVPSASGGILVVKLPPHDVQGVVSVLELKQSSVVQRLLTGWMPTAIRGDQGPSDLPISLCVHCLEHDAFLFALCQDHKLRMWSYKDQLCLMVWDMLEYIPVNRDLRHTLGSGHRLRLAFSPSTGLYLGVYLHAPRRGQFCVFQLVSVEQSRYSLDHISSLYASQEMLVDFALTPTDVWALWQDEENQTIVKYINFDYPEAVNLFPMLFEIPTPSLLLVIGFLDQQEAYLEVLFSPGRFTVSALLKALQIFRRGTERIFDLSWDTLRKEVTLAVENELLNTVTVLLASSTDYRCSLLPDCVLYKYDHVYALMIGYTGWHLLCILLRKGYISFLVPCSLVDHLYLSSDEHLQTEDETAIADDLGVGRDVLCLAQCLRLVRESISDEMAFLMETTLYHLQAPEQAAERMLEDLLANDSENAIEDVRNKLQDLQNPANAMGMLLRDMDYETDVEIDQHLDQLPQPFSPLSVFATFNLFLVPLPFLYALLLPLKTTAKISSLVCTALAYVLQVFLGAGGGAQLLQLQHELMPRTAHLLSSYYLVRWVSKCLASAIPVDTLESNLQHLSVLELSDSPTLTPFRAVSSPHTVVELFFQNVGRKQIVSQLFSRLNVSSETSLSWPQMVASITSYLLQHLWPNNSGFLFPECLMGNCQYVQLQEYVRLLQPWCQVNVGSCRFVLGQCYLVMGESQKALECFREAAFAVGREEFLHRLIRVEDEEALPTPRLQYYNKVLRLLEDTGLPELVIQLATIALTESDRDWKSQAALRTRIFKHHLDLGHNTQAYEALTQNPDPSRQKQFGKSLCVCVCVRVKYIISLIQFFFPPRLCYFAEVVGIIESRARAVDLMTHNYYELLYAFHIYRHNYRKAGTVMFEYGMRLGREVRTRRGLQKQVNCYLAAINCLRLIRPEYAWIVQPASGGVYERPGASPKRSHDGDYTAMPTNQKIEILELKDLEREYKIAQTRLTLAHHDPTSAAIAGNASAEEMVALLVQAGLFDTAVSLCQTFKLSLNPVFEGLTFKCIKLQCGGEAVQTQAWDWLAANQLSSVVTTKESSAADEAWRLLSSFLDRYQSQNSQYHRCVINKLLSHGISLPSWLINSYKEVDAAGLLRLYLNYDLLEEAVELALEFVDALLGRGHQYFGIEKPLSATAPLVWLPYSAIDQLLQALGENQISSHSTQLFHKLQSKLDDYYIQVERATRDFSHHPRRH